MATSTIKLPPTFRVVAQTGATNETYAQKMARLQSAYNTLSENEKISSFLAYGATIANIASSLGQYSRTYSFYSSQSQKNEIETWVYDIPNARVIEWGSRTSSTVDASENTITNNFKLCVRM